jgi:hypothetical protein
MAGAVSRRDFARMSALAGLGAAMAAELRGGQFNYPWKLGVISDEVSLDLPKALSTFFPKYQLDWTEIRNVNLNGKSNYVYKAATPDQLREIRKQLDDAHVKLAALDTAVYKIPLPGTRPIGKNDADLHPAQGEFEKQLEDLKHAAEAAHTLGTNRLRIFTFARVADPNSIFQRILDEVG